MMGSMKNDAATVFELEKAKKRLEDELAEAREQIVELKDALQLADDTKSRTDVMHQVAKQEWNRQLRVAEGIISRVSAEVSSWQFARRKASAERDNLAEELSALRHRGVIGQEEKKKFEKIIRDLQDMLEEEQDRIYLVSEDLRKALAQARALGVRIMERNVQSEVERRETEQHLVPYERLYSRYKAERQRAQELEQKEAAANSKCRKISRQLMDMNNVNDSLTRELNALRARAAMADDRRLLSASRDLRRFGSNNSITEDDDYVALGTRSISSVEDSDN
ncbi:hypothetical protein GCK32_000048 [Trichostrongylus colubriformis]|uniref:Uncharacterized protein n=1 Tax=Trichostrongylus colubriformis TaxID=6319 RepID=A0AAN8FSH4_TRICO